MLNLLLLAALAAGLPFETSFLGRHSDRKLPELKFRDNGTFHITVFSDFHLGEMPAVPSGPARDLKTLQVMRHVLSYENPDFVVLNGDLITGEAASKRNNTRYIDQLVQPLMERNLTWASTYGEHDHAFFLRADSILRRERKLRGSRTRKMVKHKFAGTSNYYLAVYAADCIGSKPLDCQPELLLWFFDSRGGYYYNKVTRWGNPAAQPNWVHESVVKWFQETNNKLVKAANRTIPALAFVHIPVKMTTELQRDGRADVRKNPGINDDVPVSNQGRRWCDEETYDLGALNCVDGKFDAPFMDALATTPGLMGLFYGHDHGNTWCHRVQSRFSSNKTAANGLNLCYGQHTGYGGYGSWIRGGRQIVVNRVSKELELRTHIRLEDGRTVGNVHLNSTFNDDVYPATPNDKTYLKLR